MPIILMLTLTLGIALGWAISRKWIASRIKPQLTHLARPFNSRATRHAGEQIARIVGA